MSSSDCGEIDERIIAMRRSASWRIDKKFGCGPRPAFAGQNSVRFAPTRVAVLYSRTRQAREGMTPRGALMASRPCGDDPWPAERRTVSNRVVRFSVPNIGCHEPQ